MTLDEALSASRALIVFTANWCEPCESLKPLLAGLPAAVVDVEAEPDLARQHRVLLLPTIIALRDGVPVWTHMGPATRARLEDLAWYVRENIA